MFYLLKMLNEPRVLVQFTVANVGVRLYWLGKVMVVFKLVHAVLVTKVF